MTRAEVYSGFSIVIAAVMAVFFGFTGAAQAASISTTGPDSENIISSIDWDECEIINKNEVDINSSNNQKAITGEAVVAHNTKGGNATSGDAKNTSSTDVSIAIENDTEDQLRWCDTDGDGVGDAVISKTGPHSYNKITSFSGSKAKIFNHNNVGVYNINHQYAKSGKAYSSHNTKGGNAHSGNAGNHSSTKAHGKVSNGTAKPSGSSNHKSNKPSASIHYTGPNSYNKISHKSVSNTKVYNHNNVGVKSYNNQYATSGSAKVTGNTYGGNATSGSSSNYASSNVSISIKN